MPYLQHFPENEIYLDVMQAEKILNFFGFTTAGTMITTADREFAQAILVEAIDSSKQMSYIETLFRSASKPGSSVQSIIKAFALKALTKWFKSKMSLKSGNIEIYESIRSTIRWKTGTIWRMRENGLDMLW